VKILLYSREDMRLFICVWVPDDLREKIKKFQQKMIDLPIKAKFVEMNNLHFTVTFLGETSDEKLPGLKSKLDESVKNIDRLSVKIGELKAIPNENYIRVLGLKVKDGEKIADLIKNVADSIGGKYYLEQKITLCRIKKIFEKKELQEFIRINKNIKIGEFQVDAVSLVRSKLTKSGPIYENIHNSYLK
jgi:2'-5' RNA ligase